MFAGMRNDGEDFLYKDRIIEICDSLIASGCQIKLYLACSRNILEQLSKRDWVTVTKGYVQDFLRQENVQVALKQEMISGHIMVCGNKNTLGKAV